MTAADQPTDTPGRGQPSAPRRYAEAGLEPLGLTPNEDELAVIEAVDALYRPVTEALLNAELDDVEPEPGADLSRGPQNLERR